MVFAVMVAGLGTLCSADTPKEQPDDPKGAMVLEMQTAVGAIAAKHGNISFTQIFTNEPQRAAAVRRRFMEIEQADNLGRQIVELENKSKTLQETIRAEEAQVDALERKIAAKKSELASLTPPPPTEVR